MPMTNIAPLLLTSQRHRGGVTGVEVVSSGEDGLPQYDVLPTGAGTALSTVVTRCKRALTGQELGQWRRIRSLYWLIWVAI
jgi:hypothetical protein